MSALRDQAKGLDESNKKLQDEKSRLQKRLQEALNDPKISIGDTTSALRKLFNTSSDWTTKALSINTLNRLKEAGVGEEQQKKLQKYGEEWLKILHQHGMHYFGDQYKNIALAIEHIATARHSNSADLQGEMDAVHDMLLGTLKNKVGEKRLSELRALFGNKLTGNMETYQKTTSDPDHHLRMAYRELDDILSRRVDHQNGVTKNYLMSLARKYIGHVKLGNTEDAKKVLEVFEDEEKMNTLYHGLQVRRTLGFADIFEEYMRGIIPPSHFDLAVEKSLEEMHKQSPEEIIEKFGRVTYLELHNRLEQLDKLEDFKRSEQFTTAAAALMEKEAEIQQLKKAYEYQSDFAEGLKARIERSERGRADNQHLLDKAMKEKAELEKKLSDLHETEKQKEKIAEEYKKLKEQHEKHVAEAELRNAQHEKALKDYADAYEVQKMTGSELSEKIKQITAEVMQSQEKNKEAAKRITELYELFKQASRVQGEESALQNMYKHFSGIIDLLGESSGKWHKAVHEELPPANTTATTTAIIPHADIKEAIEETLVALPEEIMRQPEAFDQEKVDRAYRKLEHALHEIASSRLSSRMDVKANKRAVNALREFSSSIYNLIAEERAKPDKQFEDLYSAIEQRMEKNTPYSERSLAHDLIQGLYDLKEGTDTTKSIKDMTSRQLKEWLNSIRDLPRADETALSAENISIADSILENPDMFEVFKMLITDAASVVQSTVDLKEDFLQSFQQRYGRHMEKLDDRALDTLKTVYEFSILLQNESRSEEGRANALHTISKLKRAMRQNVYAMMQEGPDSPEKLKRTRAAQAYLQLVSLSETLIKQDEEAQKKLFDLAVGYGSKISKGLSRRTKRKKDPLGVRTQISKSYQPKEKKLKGDDKKD